MMCRGNNMKEDFEVLGMIITVSFLILIPLMLWG
tara:strand:+ start:396 stop:497 length:102 start_codon:yes stop_codon:yes gene_type:complete